MGKTSPDSELCERFNLETNNVKDMNAYSDLVKSVIAGIVPAQMQDDLLAMTMGRVATPEIQPQNFELITWLFGYIIGYSCSCPTESYVYRIFERLLIIDLSSNVCEVEFICSRILYG
jgi:hypothetical protein